MAQEHQEYIQSKVNPTLENLVTQVLLERPENPVPFMIQWLAQQTKASTQLDSGEAERLRNEIKALQADVGELEAKVGPAAGADASSVSATEKVDDKGEAESEEEDDDDDVDELPPPPAAYLKKGPRESVSAEAYGEWNQVKEFTPPVHAKTEEQKGRLIQVLNLSWLFQGIEKANLDIIVDAMLEKEVPSNERIIQEGADGDCMYVIEKGDIECLKKISGTEQSVKSCGPGDFFGELALLYNCPRAASVEARSDCVLWQLDRETFNHIVRDASMKKRQTYELFLDAVPLLSHLGKVERAALAESLRQESVKAGTAVIKQGDSGSRFYLVENGELTASKVNDDTSREVYNYKRGDYFGELALMKNECRAATVEAVTDCDLLWVDRKTFKSLLGSIEDIMARQAKENYLP